MWLTPKTLDGVVAAGLCSGCGLCARGEDVEMRLSAEGHLRPTAREPLTASRERDLVSTCPGASVSGNEPSVGDDLTWGPVLSHARVFAADAETRYRGSSGGALTAIASHLISSRAVDFVLQVGGSRDAPLRSARHLSASPQEALERAGSRYAPAAVLEKLEPLLTGERRFAVIGRPCEIAALRVLARRDPRVDAHIPYMLSFFCAGVPSQRGTDELVERMSVVPGAVTTFRYRGHGWPGAATAITGAGARTLDYDQAWGDVLQRYVQFRCRICPDATGELADLVAADAWHIAEGAPDFSDRPGVSAILVRTQRGQRLFDSCVEAGVLASSLFELSDLALMQPYQVRRKRSVAARLAGLALIGRPLPRYRRLRLVRNALKLGPITLLRAAAGTALRGLRASSRA